MVDSLLVSQVLDLLVSTSTGQCVSRTPSVQYESVSRDRSVTHEVHISGP